MIITKKSFDVIVDPPPRENDIQLRLQDVAIHSKFEVKDTPLIRLHSIRTSVSYYEQIVSNRQGNVANTAPLNDFDTNLVRFRKITDFLILTSETLQADIQKDIATDINFNGEAKILPNTVVPTVGDYFVMKVFNSWHIFLINNVVSAPIEQNAGYEISFSLFRQNIQIETCILDENVKETYTFFYNHVGTDFRTILKDEESRFVKFSREIMNQMTESYVKVFYHKTLNTVMVAAGDLPLAINDQINHIVLSDYNNMVGQTVMESRTIYDIELSAFINKFSILSMSEKINYFTEHIKPDHHFYNKSIFSVAECRDITRFVGRKQRLVYMNSNLYNHQNRLYGRFLVEHDGDPSGATDPMFLDLFPVNFVNKLTNYNSDTLINMVFNYTHPNDLFADLISTFINEKVYEKRILITIKLLNYLYEHFVNRIFPDDFENAYEIFYTFPLVIYVLKYTTRELSLVEFR